MMNPAIALALALVLSGCIFASNGGPEDLGPVCERKSTTPWHPYSPEDLMGVTAAPAWLSPNDEHTLLNAAAPRLLTQGGAPYKNFTASLTNDSSGWWFRATGDYANLTDAYELLLDKNDTAPAEVEAPNALRFVAWHVVNQTGETSDVGTRGTLLGASWRSDLPGCVKIAFSTAGNARPTEIEVSMDLYRVVQAQGPLSS